VRAFIAIPLPADLKAKLVLLQQAFRRLPVEATWVREAGFHLTLKFLGEVESAQLGPIVSCMTAAAQGCEPFGLTLCGVGVFPHELNPRALWVGIEDETGRLYQLQQRLEARLTQIGFPPEDRPFAPHLTLARLKRLSRRGEFVAQVKGHSQALFGHIDVRHLELIESHLHPAGAHYSTVKMVSLQETIDTSKMQQS
jgi:RNA 2',3'-cyclic 3'-phosphodiesterase